MLLLRALSGVYGAFCCWIREAGTLLSLRTRLILGGVVVRWIRWMGGRNWRDEHEIDGEPIMMMHGGGLCCFICSVLFSRMAMILLAFFRLGEQKLVGIESSLAYARWRNFQSCSNYITSMISCHASFHFMLNAA